MMPNLDLNKLLQILRNNPLIAPKHCENCGFEHTSNDLRLESAQNGMLTMRLQCNHCGLVQMLKLNSGGGLSIQRFETNNSDITGAEFSKFAGKPAVHIEEALDVYEAMLDVENIEDFLQLVRPKRLSA